MKSESINLLTASTSEETFTIPDLVALSQRAEASEEVNDNARRINLAASALLNFFGANGDRKQHRTGRDCRHRHSDRPYALMCILLAG